MPIYEYQCDSCGKKLEKLQSSYDSLKYCEEIDSTCKSHGKLNRLISNFAFSGASSSSENGDCCAMDFSSKSGHQHSGGCGCGMSNGGCFN